MKKLLSLLGLAGLLVFITTPIYAQDVEDDVEDGNAIVTSAEDEFNYGVDEDGNALETVVSEDTIENSTDLDELDFNHITKDEEFKNIFGGSELTNEDAALLYGIRIGGSLIVLVFGILMIVALRKAFKKAGESGWKAIIPIYNTYIQYKIAGMKNWFWYAILIAIVIGVIAAIIPEKQELLSNISTIICGIIYIITLFKFARKYGWGVFTSILFVLFYPICILILGFGKSKYQGKEENTVIEV